jgi:hypothetical protein
MVRSLRRGNRLLKVIPYTIQPKKAVGRPPANPPHIVGRGPRLSTQGQRKASAPGTGPIAPEPQPLQAKKELPQRVPPCAWIGRRQMG